MGDQPRIRRVRVVVTGRVQGVFFRDSARALARELGIGGTVRNCADGTVEATFEGPEPAVDRAIAWCRTGPERAEVSDVEVHDEVPVGASTFRIC